MKPGLAKIVLQGVAVAAVDIVVVAAVVEIVVVAVETVAAVAVAVADIANRFRLFRSVVAKLSIGFASA
jgi:hypothetical protein